MSIETHADHHHHHDIEWDDDLDDHHDHIDKPKREVGQPIRWYRPRITREQLAELNRKNDWLGLAQTLGYLLTITATGTLFVWTCFAFPYVAPLALLLHGGCMAFLINGFHELVHESVFKRRWLNGLFLRIFSFLGWYNHISFWASHTEHHKFTLHPPDDQEVVLPVNATRKQFFKLALVDYHGFWWTAKATFRSATGKLNGSWETHLFTEVNPQLRPALHRWSRIVFFGHAAIIVGSIALGWWPIAIAVTFAKFFGNGVFWLCNSSQHIGLVDHFPDFRMCCRTIYLNPVLRFLYWHMNFHTEHHMYAGVPCYKLGKLHNLIKHEMPKSPNGLYETWTQISQILARQKKDPTYQYFPKVANPITSPETAKPTE
jgi:fatty acid desaturase